MLITNGRVVTFGETNEIMEGGAVRVDGALITDVGPTAQLLAAYPQDDVVDAGGQLIMPGNICGHTHFYGSFARGMAIPGEPPRDFPEILEKLWWRLDRALLAEDVKYSALVCLVDAIKHGTTTLIDHHASPSALGGSLDLIAEAVGEAGLRASLCYEVTDRNGMDEAAAGIAENVRFLRTVKGMDNPLLAASFGLHASLTLSDETLADCVAAAQGLDTGFHIHAAEGVSDQEDSLRKSGKRVVERLHDAGILGPLRARRRLGTGDPARHRNLGDAPAAVQHEQRGGHGPGGDDAARRDQGSHGQRWILQQYVGRMEGGLPGAQAMARRSPAGQRLRRCQDGGHKQCGAGERFLARGAPG
jgi:cytosine/adenosine deaminase-related metal-dependent hydrolase